MNRKRRLQSAGKWISEYNGKRIVKGYANRFKVDLLFAIKELRLCGVEISAEYEARVRQSNAAQARMKAKRKHAAAENTDEDHEIAFIAGYTSGSVPYGITWDEMQKVGAPGIEDSTFRVSPGI
jgi:hypothetical protein